MNKTMTEMKMDRTRRMKINNENLAVDQPCQRFDKYQMSLQIWAKDVKRVGK
jgi:hypothetical protein